MRKATCFSSAARGPLPPAFNAFNPLFNRNQATLTASGLVGENSTWAGEGIASGIYNKLSMSAGYSHFETDGWRINADQDDDVANVFAQYEFNYKTSIQAEYRYRDIQYGDLEQRFFSEDHKLNQRTTEESNFVRLGLRHAFRPDSILIGNFSYQGKDTNLNDKPDPPTNPMDPVLESIDVNVDGQKAFGAELGYLFRSDYFNVTTGAGYFDIDAEQQTTTELTIPGIIIPIPPPVGPIILPPQQVTNTEITDRDVQHTNLYLYSYIKYPQNVTFTLGASGDFFDTKSPNAKDKNLFNPKLGVSWNLSTNTTLRAAAFRVLKRSLITDQTLEPTQVAGFNQFFDDPDGAESWRYGAAIDQKFTNSIFGGLEFSKRDLKVPYQEFNLVNGSMMSEIKETDWDEYLGRAYLFWTPHNWLSLTAEYLYEKAERAEEFTAGIKEVKTHRVPLGFNFFHPSGLGLFFKATYFNQDGEFQRLISGNFESGSDKFWIADAAISYRLPKRYGFITIGAKNLFDKEFNYQDTDIRNPIIQPDRTIFGRITLAIP